MKEQYIQVSLEDYNDKTQLIKELGEALSDIRLNNAGSKERERGWENALSALEKAGYEI